MNFPDNLKYTQEHEWVRVEEDLLIVGITDHAQRELGDIVFVEVETEGDEIEKDEVFGTIEAVKTVSDLFMPVSGTVVEVNEALADAPEKVNEDPYEEGWIIKLKPNNIDELEELLDAASYKKEIGIDEEE